MSDQQQQEQDAYNRALVNGCVWLNPVFVTRNGRFRLWRRSNIRLSVTEMLWVTISMIVLGFTIYFVAKVLTYLPIINTLVSPFLFALVGIPLGWFTGRKIAKASPYRRHSGEGLDAYLWVQADKSGSILGRLFGRRVAVNKCTTMVSGKPEVVPCVEWVGTARAPMMTRFDPTDSLQSQRYMDVILTPSNTPVPWVREARQRERDGRMIRRSPNRRNA